MEKVFNFEQFLQFLYNKNERINEGGAYGHLMHPFEDTSLTFKDFLNLIEIAVNGAFTEENFVEEKTDGQNLLFTFKNGRLLAARNKGHLKNYGENALTVEQLAKMFDGRGALKDAFLYAAQDLENAIKALPPKIRHDFFEEGKKFMSVEVIYPETQNVIPYGLSMLIFHGIHEYDEKGNVIAQDKKAARVLSEMIKNVNAHVQKKFEIRGPHQIKLMPLKDAKAKEKYYKKKLLNILNKFKELTLDSTLSDYLKVWWEKFIENKFPYVNEKPEIKEKLVLRWALGDKSYNMRQIAKDLPEYANEIKEFEKKELQYFKKKALNPLEELFIELGADILSNISNILALSPEKAAQALKTYIEETIKEIRASDDAEAIEKLETELQRLNAAGGLEKLVPTEGITFMYKGKLYKFTGLFAPVNQIIGILKYKR